jgi:Chromosome segregation ATPases
MNFKILKIILWPKKENTPFKEITFNSDKVNIIVGDSQTGKSAIIPIIDYCLGSQKCTIPIGPIRDYTSWFGIVVSHDSTEILFARPDPGMSQTTGDMYYDEGIKVSIPEKLVEKNSNRNMVVNRLNQLCKLPNIKFSEDDTQPYENRPSFRDFIAFNFQPQHIIANPYTLYYKADTIEHKLKLRTIFPLALGLVTAESLEVESRLKTLRDELRKKQLLMEEKNKIRDAFFVDAKTNYLKALELGLLTDAPFPEEYWNINDYLNYLIQIPERIKTFKLPSIDIGSSNKVINYITKLQKSEKEILDLLDERRYKLQLLKNFNESSRGYNNALITQKDRLEYVANGWLNRTKNSTCPVCGSENSSAHKDIENLFEAFDDLNSKLAEINRSKDILSKEVTLLEKEIIELEQQLNTITKELELLNARHNQLEQRRRTVENTYRFVGKIEQDLKNLEDISIDGGLSEEIIILQEQIDKLLPQTNTSNYVNSLRDALQRIATSINYYKQLLLVENYDNPTNIDIKDLTLEISSKSGRRDYLWEIGSGSNWLGYHIATILSLQEYFLKLSKKNNHVPSFIVFDQPSQAYFPELTKNDENSQLNSDDLQRVKSIFTAFSNFVNRTKKGVQIIVLEHASHDIWGSIEHTHYVGGTRWVTGNALIPNDWMT